MSTLEFDRPAARLKSRVAVIEHVAHCLLHRRYYDVEKECKTPPAIQLHHSLQECIDSVIGLGTGFSIHNEDLEPYWFCNTSRGTKIELLYRDQQGGIVTDQVSRKEFMDACQAIWMKEKHGQLTLF